MIVTISAGIAIVLLAFTILLGLLRIASSKDGASRAVVGDLVFFCAIGIMVILGILTPSTVVIDATLIASLLGVLATIALARILTRGRR
ncbi:monovalent cation/H+ antiporter complex subunit F [Dermabacteraceae bacterium P13115]|nr:transporter [Dermabacteraceae bacterium TAE3-ERU27]MBV7433059.1 transporter [Dermabacteraceae bacterium TAE3-ERU5]